MGIDTGTRKNSRGKRAISKPRLLCIWGTLLLFGVTASACGAQAGAGIGGAGQGLIVLSFLQDGFDNLSFNQVLEWRFSEDVDPNTIADDSIQIREGPTFGKTVPGTFRVAGAIVTWEPDLPGLCDLSDGAFKGDTQYRIQTIGFPEQFAIRNTHGQPLNETSTYEFHTRLDTDPLRFIDAIPATPPSVVTATPSNGDQAVDVADGNEIRLTITENLDPCTVNGNNILLHIYEFGDPAVFVDAPNGLDSGFAVGSDTSDQLPLDPFAWGAPGSTTLPLPQEILKTITLAQGFGSTEIVITPDAGRFPEDSLCVLQLTSNITDFAGDSLTPFMISFTTENLPIQTGAYVMEAAGETPFDEGLTTADVNTARSPSLVQGFLLFSGDGDNGANPNSPTLPQSDTGTCLNDYQSNDGIPDDFDPTGDVLLDTGSTPNPCPNATDGSFAVIWEFKTLTIRDGITVRIIGINPAIILVQGSALIENGGRLLARGDNQGGSPRGAGEGNKTATTNARTLGGIGVAGGGDGGSSHANSASSRRVGLDGVQGYFHATPTGPLDPSVGSTGVGGSGRGNTSAHWTTQTTNNRNTPSGGGGGHAEAGGDGTALGTGSSPTSLDLPTEGEGGAAYGDTSGRMLKPEAGSGGGAGGELRPFSGTAGRGPGGAGGAGGGFIDLTVGGDLTVLGTIDAAGSVGGSNPGGNFNPNYTFNPGTGGGGGGSGGGVRLLTPNDIIFGATTVVTVAGGPGGAGGKTQGSPATPVPNDGGPGGVGRLCMEDGNSVIANLASASVSPAEGNVGFYRGIFDATRFQGGGLSPQAVSELFAVGPLNPMYINPVQNYGVQEDFIAGVPVATTPGVGMTAILIEARAYQMLPNATPDLTGVIAPPTGWFTVGHFTDSGVENLPTWNLGQPSAGQLPSGLPGDNVGSGITNLDDFEFLQLRISLYLPSSAGPTDPGAFIDRWTIRFTSDQ